MLTWSAPRRATGRAWRILEDVWALEPESGRTALLPALRHLAANLKTMSVIFLISDFITEEDVFGSQELRMLASRQDVIAVIVEDPAETALPAGGGYIRIRDAESGAPRTVALNDESRASYARGSAPTDGTRGGLLPDPDRLCVRTLRRVGDGTAARTARAQEEGMTKGTKTVALLLLTWLGAFAVVASGQDLRGGDPGGGPARPAEAVAPVEVRTTVSRTAVWVGDRGSTRSSCGVRRVSTSSSTISSRSVSASRVARSWR